VKDPVALDRAIGHAESFFREVLAYDPPAGDIQKEAKKGSSKNITTGISKPVNEKQLKQMSINDRLSEYDAMINSYFGGKL
jgi:hypothetical protein